MDTLSSSSLGLSYSDIQSDWQKVKKSQEAVPQKIRSESSSQQPRADREPSFGTSLYDVYGLEKGFSNNSGGSDSVEISKMAEMLYRAEQNREVWSSGSDSLFKESVFEDDGTISRRINPEYADRIEPNLLAGQAEFNGLFKEAISEDGETILRRINPHQLDRLTTVEEALYLHEKFHESVEGKMVISLGQDTSEILLRLHSLANQDRYDTVTGLVDNASALYDRHQDFKDALASQHPSLAGTSFEFGLEGGELKVLNANIGSHTALDGDQVKLIENFANSNNYASKRLLEVMYEIREASVNFYNMWSDSGRSEPIDISDFDDRFGSFNSYLQSFHGAGGARGKTGPDDPTTYRDAYFSNAADYAASRLAGRSAS